MGRTASVASGCSRSRARAPRRRTRSSARWRPSAACAFSAGTTSARRNSSRAAIGEARDRFLEGGAHRAGGWRAPATAVTGQDPFEAEVAQPLERAELALPVVPADAAAHVEALVVFVPP